MIDETKKKGKTLISINNPKAAFQFTDLQFSNTLLGDHIPNPEGPLLVLVLSICRRYTWIMGIGRLSSRRMRQRVEMLKDM